jgi:hypothetical protein
MTPYRFLFILFVCLFVFSCEDDNPAPFKYPSVYVKSGFEAVSAVRAFDKNGEITNRTIVEDLAELDTSFFFGVLRYYTQYIGLVDTVRFADATHVTLMQAYSKYECTIEVKKDLLILSDNTIKSNCCTGGEVYSRTFNYMLGSVKDEVFSESIRSSTAGHYLFNFTIRKKFVLRKENGKLTAPFILYLIRGEANDYTAMGNLNNVPEAEFYMNLGEGEILTMMESQIVLEESSK